MLDTTEPEPLLSAQPVPVDDGPREPPPAPPAQRQGPVPNHAGEPLPADADFFALPPDEIGPIVSAYTTLRQGKQPLSTGARLIGLGFAGLAGLGVGVLLVTLAQVRSEFWQVVWPLGGGVACLALALWATGFTHTCTYVGQEGVARFVCSGSRYNVTEREVFRFRDATELRTSQTLRYVNGVYQGTSYGFHWTDVGGRQRYEITGTHKSEAGTPPATDPYQFARATEVAWTVYLLGQVHRQIELAGSVAFNLKGGQWVRLAPGQIIFGLDGTPVECDAADMDVANVQKGVVRLKRKDAREGWFSSRGVYKFNFADLANAQLFFHLLDQMVGIPVR
jgi:hypothetical protein